jgi:uncharacterized protein with HEPN domain
MNDKDRLTLNAILRHCTNISERIDKHGINVERFMHEGDTADMLLMPLIQIGELAARLSQEYRVAHPDIPWQQIKEFRNVIVHDYDRVILPWVWSDITDNLPKLVRHCQDSLND